MEQSKIFEVTEFKPEYTRIINKLLAQLITTTPVKFTDEDLLEIIASKNSWLFFCYHEGEIAGMLSIGSYKTPTGQKYWVEDVVVDNNFRGKSLGRKLIEHAIHYVGSQGGNPSLMLTTSFTRIAANELFKSVGFELKQSNVYKMTF